MNSFTRVLKYEFLNVIRNRWVFAFMFLLTALSFTFIRMAGDYTKALVSLASITVVLVPLTSCLFSAFYWYYSDRFTEMLLTQPIRRSHVFLTRVLALTISLGLSFIIGTAIPFLFHGEVPSGLWVLIGVGLFLTVVFATLGSLIAVAITDRMKGVGLALGIWLYFSIVHDGLILLLLLIFKDYPLDVPGAFLGTINPIGLSRVVLLMYNDAALLLGHTGALMRNLFTGNLGYLIAAGFAAIWSLTPTALGLRRFLRRDF